MVDYNKIFEAISKGNNMSDRAYAKVQAQQKTLIGSSPKHSLLQRTCACGQHTIAGGECSACRNEQSTLLRSQRVLESSSTPVQENVPTLNSGSSRAPHFGHDFSRIPIHSPRQVLVQPEQPPRFQSVLPVSAKGETLGDEELFSPLKGEPGTGTEGESATKGEGAKTAKKTELAPPTAGQCGAYSWKVRFSVENADATTNGYIVQKVDAIYTRKDCTAKDEPVTGIGTFPYWEAWGVRGGKVFIGDTEQPHNADTYADRAMGDSTYGSIAVRGTAKFFSNAVLPAHMKADNPDTQAGSLRSSLTDPALTGGTGSIPHDLTASWNCCGPLLPGAKERMTTFSNKK